MASLDQSLKRMNLDYVDIFYHHRPDPETPIEETMGALDQIVRSGKALYVGISRYTPEQTEIAIRTLRELGTPMLIHQENYSMLNRKIEHGLTDVLTREGVGLIAFGPLAGGRLTGKYQSGIPADSRKRATPLLLLLLIPFFLRRSEIANGNFSSLLPPVVFIVLFLAVWYLFSHAEEKRAERLEKRYDAEDETK